MCTVLHVDLFVLSGTVWNWDVVVMMIALPLLKFLLMFKLCMVIGRRPKGGMLFRDEPITVLQYCWIYAICCYPDCLNSSTWRMNAGMGDLEPLF